MGDITLTQPNPAEPNPAEPNPAEPTPTEPNPAEPTPTEPTPTEPTPTEPNPAEPNPDSKNENLASLDSVPVEEDVIVCNSNIPNCSDNDLSAQAPASLENDVFCRENIPPSNRADQ